jgi:hypothetical protein
MGKPYVLLLLQGGLIVHLSTRSFTRWKLGSGLMSRQRCECCLRSPTFWGGPRPLWYSASELESHLYWFHKGITLSVYWVAFLHPELIELN